MGDGETGHFWSMNLNRTEMGIELQGSVGLQERLLLTERSRHFSLL